MDRASWPLGLYCERTQLGFWAEPLNTWSNLVFLLAAFAAWRRWRAGGGKDYATLGLIATLAAIGCGSFAFHAAPSRTTLLMDVLPIQAFVLFALFCALRRYLAWSLWMAAAAVGAFFLGSGWIVGAIGSGALRGGIGYVPPLLAMPAIAALAYRRSPGKPEARDVAEPIRLRAAARTLLLATAVFAVSLLLRTFDQPLCPIVPTGLHFLWHGLNAVVLFLLIDAQQRFSSQTDPAA
jgi:hypothetical protein